jgi:hypothetical protein
VHATVAGVLLGLLTPVHAPPEQRTLVAHLREQAEEALQRLGEGASRPNRGGINTFTNVPKTRPDKPMRRGQTMATGALIEIEKFRNRFRRFVRSAMLIIMVSPQRCGADEQAR